MANASYVTSLLGGLDPGIRAAWRRVWDHVLTDIAFGSVDDQQRAENLRGHFYMATTPSTADVEFTVAHGLGITPRLAFPVVPLNAVNARSVPLTVTRAADTQRIYLSSGSTSAVIYLYVE